MEVSEPTVLLKSVEVNGLGLLTPWVPPAAPLMDCKSLMVVFSATSIQIMRGDSGISAQEASKTAMNAGQVGLVIAVLVP